MKRILFVGDAGSSHLVKWAKAIHGNAYQVAIFSLTPPAKELEETEGLEVYVYGNVSQRTFSSSLARKYVYLFATGELRKMINSFRPDILHAHYASSYGLLAARSGFHPLVISAWGSDVYSFGDTLIGSIILRYNFRKADCVLSTSHVMRTRILKFTSKEVFITPFGVDTAIFHPGKTNAPFFPADAFVFGMVKSMEDIYGVDLLINAFSSLVKHNAHLDLRLLLVGSGTKMDAYKMMCGELGISDVVHFSGRVAHNEIPAYHRMMNVFVNPSRMESFGVSVLEAMSCEKPVIVSAVGGLEEIVADGVNGLICLPDNVASLLEKMEQLLGDPALRTLLAEQARRKVMRDYDWEGSVRIMMDEVYDKLNS